MKKPTKKSLLKKIDKQERDITKLISERNRLLDENNQLSENLTKSQNELISAQKETEKFKDLQKDYKHSEEKHGLKDKIIHLLEDRPKEVKVEVQPANVVQPYNNNGVTTTSSTATTMYPMTYGYKKSKCNKIEAIRR
jgi:seryl-tRNA synthetase